MAWSFYGVRHNGYGSYGHGFCLRDDTKPTRGILNGSDCVEMDTSKIYLYDEENQEWLEWGAEEEAEADVSPNMLNPGLLTSLFDQGEQPGIVTPGELEMTDAGPVEE